MSMWAPFSENLRRAVVQAQEEAQRMNAGHIGTEHLLLGLVSGGDQFVVSLLGERGVTLQSLRDALGPPGESPVTARDMAFTSDAKRTIELTFDVARRAGHSHLSPLHMLAALTGQRNGDAARILAERLGGAKGLDGLERAIEAELCRESSQRRAPAESAVHRDRLDEAEAILYGASLAAAASALGAGAGVDALRETARRLYEAALADIANARPEREP